MSNTQDLIKEAAALIKEVKDNPELTQGSAIISTDLFESAKPLLSEEAIKSISNKFNTLTYRDETGFYECIFIGAHVRKENTLKGLKIVCDSLNTLAEHDLIHSCLALPSSVDFARMPFRANSSAVYCFVLVPSDKKAEAEKLAGCSFPEGAVPESVDCLELELKEDEFFAKIELSYFTLANDKSGEERLQDAIKGYLNVLPNGTEVVEIVPCSIMHLSIPYEVRFRNPLMKAFKEVRLEYRRHAEEVGDKIEQFNLLQKVEYIEKSPPIFGFTDTINPSSNITR